MPLCGQASPIPADYNTDYLLTRRGKSCLEKALSFMGVQAFVSGMWGGVVYS